MDHAYYIRGDDVLCREERPLPGRTEILWPDGRWTWYALDPSDVVQVTEDDALNHALSVYRADVDLRAPNSGRSDGGQPEDGEDTGYQGA